MAIVQMACSLPLIAALGVFLITSAFAVSISTSECSALGPKKDCGRPCCGNSRYLLHGVVVALRLMC